MSNLTPYIEQIRTRIDLSEWIGKDLKLTRKGHEFMGLCPFHHE